MEIKKIVSFSHDQNCWLIYNGNTGILIDPGDDFEKILRESEGIEIPYILLTHCHYDHIKSLENIKKIKGSKVVSSSECSENLTDNIKNAAYLFGSEEKFKRADIEISHGEIFKSPLGDIKCIKTPGHTDGSVCFLIENHIFTGDTLFKLSIGRWDLATGNEDTLKKSIKERLYTLDEELIAHPGHGADTTIGYEKKYNLYIKAEK